MNPSELNRTLGELGSELALEESQAEAEARRRRVLSQMQRTNLELVREAQKVRWLRWGVGGGLVAGAAAAVSLLVLGPFTSQLESAPTAASVPVQEVGTQGTTPLRTEMTRGNVTRSTGQAKKQLGLGDSLVLEEEHVLETEEDSRARVHGGRGLDIDVGPGSRVVVGSLDAKTGAANIQLERGFVSCSVDPAGEGKKLAVVTPDATVEVKGTVFSVEVTEVEGASRSCVRVERGWVTVRRGGTVEQVRTGQASGCGAPEESAEEQSVVQEGRAAVEVRGTTAQAKSATRAHKAEAPELSPLALQNSLLALALAAERKGRLDDAEGQLSQLLSRFPDTPLRADAEAALQRIRKRKTEQSP